MADVLVTTVPFAEGNAAPLEALATLGVEVSINHLGRRLTAGELCELIGDAEVLIAGTEPITTQVMDTAPNLRLISRVGIGLDNIDLNAARERGIQISYTPDAPAPAVAELTIGLTLSLLRGIHNADRGLRAGEWQRRVGRRLSEVTFGIVGLGRVGSRVLEHLSGFGPAAILVNDIRQIQLDAHGSEIALVDKDFLFQNADVISLHVPLTPLTENLIAKEELLGMKPDALLINTARGGIVNEQELFDVISDGHLGGVAIDVFEHEPYQGPLSGLDRALLTCHMGSMTRDCRAQMENEATAEVVRYFRGQDLQNLAPENEYEEQIRH